MYITSKTQRLIIISLFICLEIIFTRFLSIQTPIVRIGFGFLPPAIIAILYGPLWSGIAYALGDIIGAILFPFGAYFPGFTITAFLTGVIFGLILYKKELTLLRVLLATSLVCIFMNLFLDTLWLKILLDSGVYGLIPSRILKTIIMIPIETSIILFIWNSILKKKEIFNIN